MAQIAIFVVLVVGAVAVAAVLNRRRPDGPTRTGYAVPDQIDRADFLGPDVPWLVALFTSSTCRSCARAWEVVAPLARDDVAVHLVELNERADLHERYRIEAVPTLVIADGDGVVRANFLGPPGRDDVIGALDELLGG